MSGVQRLHVKMALCVCHPRLESHHSGQTSGGGGHPCYWHTRSTAVRLWDKLDVTLYKGYLQLAWHSQVEHHSIPPPI